MKYIHPYSLFESILHFSPNFRDLLSRFANSYAEDGTPAKIAYNILALELSDVKPDTTFINKGKTGYISFIQSKNAEKLIKDKGLDLDKLSKSDLDDIYTDRSVEIPIYTKSRNEIKIGKFIKNIFGSQYTDKQIEDFVNKYKSVESKPDKSFEVVSGDDIAYWYKSNNYASEDGTLGSSCMRNSSESIFQIYTSNPEVCSLLILKNADDKLIGRALIWKIKQTDKNFTEFMDRVYTIEDSDINLFHEWALEKKMARKGQNNYNSCHRVFFNGDIETIYLTIQLNKHSNSYYYDYYPYMDTFRRYDPESGELINDADEDTGYYYLDSTSGGYTDKIENEDDDRVWSEHEDRMIDEEDAVFSEAVESYITMEDAVQITTGSTRNRGWYPSDNENIVFDEWLDEYIHVDDSTYSEHLEKYMYSDHAVEVAISIDTDGEISSRDYFNKDDDGTEYIDTNDLHTTHKWYEFYESQNRDMCGGISKDLLRKNYENKWILNVFAYNVYFCEEHSIYLTKRDAKYLGYTIDNDNESMDYFEYYDQLQQTDLIKLKTETEIKRLRSIINNDTMVIDYEEEDIKSDYVKALDKKRYKLAEIISNIEYWESV